jgi:hypothetical protein
LETEAIRPLGCLFGNFITRSEKKGEFMAMAFYTNDEAMTPGETTRTVKELERVIDPKVTLNRAVIFVGNGFELGFEEPEKTLKSNDQTEKKSFISLCDALKQ